MIVRMWEARAQPGSLEELLAWVCEVALPSIEVDPSHAGSEVFSSPDERLVVLSRWRGAARELPEPPMGLLTRAPRFWDFSSVDR